MGVEKTDRDGLRSEVIYIYIYSMKKRLSSHQGDLRGMPPERDNVSFLMNEETRRGIRGEGKSQCSLMP